MDSAGGCGGEPVVNYSSFSTPATTDSDSAPSLPVGGMTNYSSFSTPAATDSDSAPSLPVGMTNGGDSTSQSTSQHKERRAKLIEYASESAGEAAVVLVQSLGGRCLAGGLSTS